MQLTKLLVLLATVTVFISSCTHNTALQVTGSRLWIDSYLDSTLNDFVGKYPTKTNYLQIRSRCKSNTDHLFVAFMALQKNKDPNPPLANIVYKGIEIPFYLGIERYVRGVSSSRLPDETTFVGEANIIEFRTVGSGHPLLHFYAPRSKSINPNTILEDKEWVSATEFSRNIKKADQTIELVSAKASHFEIDSRLDSLLTSFVDEARSEIGVYADSCFYTLDVGLYDDETKGTSFILSQKYPNATHSRKHSTLFSIKHKGIDFCLYTGFERLIRSDMGNVHFSEFPLKEYSNGGKVWRFEIRPQDILFSDAIAGEGVPIKEVPLTEVNTFLATKRWVRLD